MRYCVLIHMSRTSISFWYQQQGAPFESLAKIEGNVVPLYFYVNCNDFILGTFAKERFLNGDTANTFGDYFKIVADPSKYFKIFGNKKHVKFLLYYAVEQYLSHFLNTVLYKKESIEEYRNNFPLRFMFSSDIVQKERLLVESIFSETGYDNVETLSYPQFLYTTLKTQRLIDPKLSTILLTGIDGNLIVELFNGTCMTCIDEEIIEEQGADPRIKIMAKMLYENAISTIHVALSEKTEIVHLLTYAKAFLEQESAIPRGDITLSDGTICYVQIKKKELNERLLYDSGEDKIFKTIDNLLTKNNISDNLVQFVLNGAAVNTSYFIERLKKKFSQVIGTPSNIQNEILKLAFRSISDAGYIPIYNSGEKKHPVVVTINEPQLPSGKIPPWPILPTLTPVTTPRPVLPAKPIIVLRPVKPPSLPPKPVIKPRPTSSSPPLPPLLPPIKRQSINENKENMSMSEQKTKHSPLLPPLPAKKKV